MLDRTRLRFAVLRDGRRWPVKVLRGHAVGDRGDLDLMRIAAGAIRDAVGDGKRLKPSRWWPSSTSTATGSFWYAGGQRQPAQAQLRPRPSPARRPADRAGSGTHRQRCDDRLRHMWHPVNDRAAQRRRGWTTAEAFATAWNVFFSRKVFSDSFFHADVHRKQHLRQRRSQPALGRYIGAGFRHRRHLVGVRQGLRQNHSPSSTRDYHRVAVLHVESGWVPRDAMSKTLSNT